MGINYDNFVIERKILQDELEMLVKKNFIKMKRFPKDTKEYYSFCEELLRIFITLKSIEREELHRKIYSKRNNKKLEKILAERHLYEDNGDINYKLEDYILDNVGIQDNIMILSYDQLDDNLQLIEYDPDFEHDYYDYLDIDN